ncbi:DUF2490 domain-containing protein [Mariniflexile gromovii]|uniref:DUF2490 domain-containing protein n=1 Tax=Mariniflexile gromovii TaxID=362523 RepID=A0ABS4BRX6_9FLAO|nr:DUF2490 domain-containing protein [Mariniflexile gromovii]MBP0903323.1 DUF2490 domain-containing protein [Mariniflexile gromovii]
MKKIVNIKPFCLFILLLSVVFPMNINAQTSNSKNLNAWSTVSIEYKLNKKWSFELAEQLRLKENLSLVDEYFTELQTEYSVNKNFSLSAGARFIRQNDTEGNIQGYENHFRFQFDASYKHKINDFKLDYRLRYQNKNDLSVSVADGDYANQHLRFKTDVEYNIKNWKLDPQFSAEIFNHFEKGEDGGFDKYRLTFGTDYDMKKYGKISLYYRFEKELNVDLPETTNIIGLSYKYTIKNK